MHYVPQLKIFLVISSFSKILLRNIDEFYNTFQWIQFITMLPYETDLRNSIFKTINLM